MKKKLSVELFKSIFSFWGIIFLILGIRWLVVEPYVIPSGSMIPNLLIHDHIVVNKFAYGVRIPFSNKLLWQRKVPSRGDVVVFRSVEDRKFMIKRVVGLPGDEISIDDKGQVWVSNKKRAREALETSKVASHFRSFTERSLGASYSDYNFFLEKTPHHQYGVMYKTEPYYRFESDIYKVPEGHLLVLGDNRDDSRDSRYWGMLPMNHLMGRAFGVWLSCEETFSFLPFLCNPLELRWGRLFRPIK